MNFSSDFKLNNAFAALAEAEISNTGMCVLANWRSFYVRKREVEQNVNRSC